MTPRSTETSTNKGPALAVYIGAAVFLLALVAAIWYGVWWFLSSRSSEESKRRRLEEEIRSFMASGASSPDDRPVSRSAPERTGDAPRSDPRPAAASEPLKLDTFVASPDDGPVSQCGPQDPSGPTRPPGVTYLPGQAGP